MDLRDLDIDWDYLLERLERLLDLGEEALSLQLTVYETDPQTLEEHLAFRWQPEGAAGYLVEVAFPNLPPLADLFGLDTVLEELRRNTRQFVLGAPANHVLLRGGQGCGKSTAVKGLLPEYGSQGLRMVEVREEDFDRLTSIAADLRERPYRFILFCDDLPDASVRELKPLLDGGLESRPENVLVYATTSWRQRTPKRSATSLADPFGIVLEIPPLEMEGYLAVVRHLADQRELHLDATVLEEKARQWTRQRSSCSGRVARQFIDDLAGRLALEEG